MNNKSRKAKGRILQNLVKDKIQKLFPVLGKDDIRTSLMSEPGADIKLISLTARKLVLRLPGFVVYGASELVQRKCSWIVLDLKKRLYSLLIFYSLENAIQTLSLFNK